MVLRKIGSKCRSAFYTYQERWLGRQVLRRSRHRAPDFFIAGAAKSGTTSLFEILSRHPEIVPPQKKEFHYFLNDSYGLSRYLSFFPLKKESRGKLTFEASVSTMLKASGIRRLKKLLPEAKLIILLRDPVDRAYSHWNYHFDSPLVREHPGLKDDRSFSRAVREEQEALDRGIENIGKHSYLYKSLYSRHLEAIFTVFPRDKVLILDFEALKSTPVETLKQVTDFLQVKPMPEATKLPQKQKQGTAPLFKAYNTTRYAEETDSIRTTKQQLRDYFQAFDKKITQLTGKKFGWMEE